MVNPRILNYVIEKVYVFSFLHVEIIILRVLIDSEK